ncbi:hypothetical protein Y032_1021g3416 [Ancylostoma ceylanicum]|nr:hypothetical protein Y032_1021g3416 [Ancylostoma ceylanicum]
MENWWKYGNNFELQCYTEPSNFYWKNASTWWRIITVPQSKTHEKHRGYSATTSSGINQCHLRKRKPVVSFSADHSPQEVKV